MLFIGLVGSPTPRRSALVKSRPCSPFGCGYACRGPSLPRLAVFLDASLSRHVCLSAWNFQTELPVTTETTSILTFLVHMCVTERFVPSRAKSELSPLQQVFLSAYGGNSLAAKVQPGLALLPSFFRHKVKGLNHQAVVLLTEVVDVKAST
jgi:hypothetical protein